MRRDEKKEKKERGGYLERNKMSKEGGFVLVCNEFGKGFREVAGSKTSSRRKRNCLGY